MSVFLGNQQVSPIVLYDHGITSTELNNDYTLTIYFTDGTSYTTSSLRGSPGIGLPSGGTAEQILSKNSNNDFDTVWIDKYPKKIFDYTITNEWEKVNITNIDYENGILTLENNTIPFTDDVNTTIRVRPMIDIIGCTTTFQYGFMPKELYTVEPKVLWKGSKAILVDTNQIKIIAENETSYITLTDSTNVNLSRFWLFCKKNTTTTTFPILTGINAAHTYYICGIWPYGNAGMKINVNFANNQSGKIFDAKTVSINESNTTPQVKLFTSYEVISDRYIANISPAPSFINMTISKKSNGLWEYQGNMTYMLWNGNSNAVTNTATPYTTTQFFSGFLTQPPISFSLGNGNYGQAMEGQRMIVYDLGESLI